ncbi:MAG TPA: hypothetical protein DCF68_13490 [Cyanothece sp. UBA12306]|nr:hypothetical protein [Cyanothece sp. UBA12306]
MIISNSLTHSIKICLAVVTLSIGTMAVSMSASAQEEVITDPKPLEIHTGKVQDLGGTESKTREEWLGGVGGEYVSTDETAEVDADEAILRIDQNSAEAKRDIFNVKLEENDPNLGDVQHPRMRVPVLNF